jgi:hypothetical protein
MAGAKTKEEKKLLLSLSGAGAAAAAWKREEAALVKVLESAVNNKNHHPDELSLRMYKVKNGEIHASRLTQLKDAFKKTKAEQKTTLKFLWETWDMLGDLAYSVAENVTEDPVEAKLYFEKAIGYYEQAFDLVRQYIRTLVEAHTTVPHGKWTEGKHWSLYGRSYVTPKKQSSDVTRYIEESEAAEAATNELERAEMAQSLLAKSILWNDLRKIQLLAGLAETEATMSEERKHALYEESKALVDEIASHFSKYIFVEKVPLEKLPVTSLILAVEGADYVLEALQARVLNNYATHEEMQRLAGIQKYYTNLGLKILTYLHEARGFDINTLPIGLQTMFNIPALLLASS